MPQLNMFQLASLLKIFQQMQVTCKLWEVPEANEERKSNSGEHVLQESYLEDRGAGRVGDSWRKDLGRFRWAVSRMRKNSMIIVSACQLNPMWQKRRHELSTGSKNWDVSVQSNLYSVFNTSIHDAKTQLLGWIIHQLCDVKQMVLFLLKHWMLIWRVFVCFWRLTFLSVDLQ